MLWTFLLNLVHVTPSIILMKKFSFALIFTLTNNVTREYFCEFLNDFIEFLLKF